MIYVVNYRDKIPEGSVAINTTSRSKTWTKGLSPFFLPGGHLYGNYYAKNVENAWQYFKVYDEHIDVSGNPTEDYFVWAQEGWNKNHAVRYPMGKDRKPLYSWWDGKKYSYTDARKKIYASVYSYALLASPAYKILRSTVQNAKTQGQDVYLIDFDGYNHVKEGLDFKTVINDPNRKFGHAFLIWFWLTQKELNNV